MRKLTGMLMAAGCLFATTTFVQAQDKDGAKEKPQRDRGNRVNHRGNWGGGMGDFDAVEIREKMEEMRKNADADGDGKLNQDERRKYFESMREGWRKHREDFVTKWDKDGNGEVDEKEKKAFEDNKVDDEFKKIDTNKDGMISPEEYKASKEKAREAAEGLRNMWRQDRGDRGRGNEDAGKGTIERFDENGDGVVDEAEKTRAAEAILKRMEEKGLSGKWKAFDKDADGILNADERAAILKNLVDRLGTTDAKKTVRPEKPVKADKAPKTDAPAK